MNMSAIFRLFSARSSVSLKNPHLWIIIALVLFLVLMYSFWPWRIWLFQGFWRGLSWLTFFQGLAVFEGVNRIIGSFFLIPSIYATIVFQLRGSLIVSIVALTTTISIMLDYWKNLDSWLANISILLLPVLLVLAINIEFQLRNRDKKYLTELEKVRRLQISKVIEGQEKERQHIAREIHDESIQTLLATASHAEKMKTMNDIDQMKSKAEWIEKTLRTTVTDLRRLIIDLRPAVLDDLGLVAAIHWLGDHSGLSQELNLKIITAGEETKLPPETELIVFRVIQEALNNIRTHAKAQNVVVSLKFSPEWLKLSIQDDGQGFTQPQRLSKLAPQGKMGLIGIQERVQSLNGKFIINSNRKNGTLIQIDIPVQI
jgi:two-component system, NarL family, sensor histidine kinase DegS